MWISHIHLVWFSPGMKKHSSWESFNLSRKQATQKGQKKPYFHFSQDQASIYSQFCYMQKLMRQKMIYAGCDRTIHLPIKYNSLPFFVSLQTHITKQSDWKLDCAFVLQAWKNQSLWPTQSILPFLWAIPEESRGCLVYKLKLLLYLLAWVPSILVFEFCGKCSRSKRIAQLVILESLCVFLRVMETSRDCMRICILLLYLIAATISFTQCGK